MVTWILAAVLAAATGDAAPAGAEYLRGLRHLQGERFDEAVRALEAAITFEPVESTILKYRDAGGRHRHPYFPYYWLARGYEGLAGQVSSLDLRRQHLVRALAHLEGTTHSGAESLRAKAEAALKKVEEEIAERNATILPPEVAPLRRKVLALCDEEKFEEAYQEIENSSDLFVKQPRAKDTIVATVRNRQNLVLQRYDDVMTARLESISRTDPTLEAETVLPLLRPACVPPEVKQDPAPHFRWILDFFMLYEKEIDRVRAAAELPTDQLLQSAATFETAAGKALGVDVFGGYRAARNMAHCLRMARLRKHVAEGDPSTPEYRAVAEAILKHGGWARTQSEALLGKKLGGPEKPSYEPQLNRYLSTDLGYQDRQLDDQKARMEATILDYERRVAADKQVTDALAGLVRDGVMSDPAELRKVQQQLGSLESKSHFATLPAAVRARVLYARAVTTATAAFLDGETPFQVEERCSSDIVRAHSLDPSIDEAWKGKLSPRIAGVFKQIVGE